MDRTALLAEAMRLHLLRHFSLTVVSEEALELSHLDAVGDTVPAVDFGALERALAEAKAHDAQLRALLAPEDASAARAELLGAMRAVWEGDMARGSDR